MIEELIALACGGPLFIAAFLMIAWLFKKDKAGGGMTQDQVRDAYQKGWRER